MMNIILEDKGFEEFSPCNFGCEDCDACHRFGPHVRNHYLIHFVTSGRGRFETPRGVYTVSEGEAFLIRPGEVTVYEADAAEPWSYVWLGFRGRLSEKFSELPDIFVYEKGFTSELCEAFDIDAGKEEYLTGMIFKLYAHIFGEKIRSDHPNKVASYINAHYMEDVSISAVAEKLGLDRKYLARIFKSKFGVSMREYLINKRLHEAKKLLLRGYTVEECAYIVGYSDYFGFSKAFKRRYGASPTKYRSDTAPRG